MKKKNKFFNTIKSKLILGYVFFLLLSITVVSIYYYYQMNRNFFEISRQYLRNEIESVSLLLQSELSSQSGMINFLSKHISVKKSTYKINYALFDKNGVLISGSKDFMEDIPSIEILRDSFYDGIYEKVLKNSQGEKILVISKKLTDDQGINIFFIQFSINSVANDGALPIILKTFIMAVPVILLFSISGGIFLTSYFLKPLKELRTSAQTLSFSDQERQLPITGSGDELDMLARTFNEVYMRLLESYHRVANFTADASHELRLPIAVIKGEAEIVLGSERSVEEYQKVLQSIIEEMDRLTHMITRLLMLARADSGEDKLKKEDIDLKECLANLTDFYRPLAESRNLKMSFESAVIDSLFHGDRIKLQELFSNLIENAIKYNKENGSVKIELVQSETEYNVIISDTGFGISVSDLKKIFQRFYRADKSRSRNDGSTGLGLNIAEMLAKEHGGSINVESTLGKGSCFAVLLPKRL